MKSTITRGTLVAFAIGTLFGAVTTGFAASGLGSDIFSDVPRGVYFDRAVGVLNERGIIKGRPDGTFDPSAPATRADISVMMYRLLQSLGEEPMDDGASESRRSRETSSAAVSSAASSIASSQEATSTKGSIHFASASLSVLENIATGGISVAVVRTGGVTGAVDVTITTSDGTAKANEDYRPVNTTVNFGQGESSKIVKISMIDDSISEGAETLTLTLAAPTNGAILGTPSTLTLTILDNEASNSTSASSGSSGSSAGAGGSGKFGYSAVTYGHPENGGTLTVTVQRSNGSSGTAAVNYATSNGTGVQGVDYSSTSGTLTFANGETSKTFPVTIVDNGSIDGNRTFNLTLSNPTSGSSLGSSTATVTVYDDESVTFGTGSLRYSKAAFSATETSGEAFITIQRIGGAKGLVKVNYATSNGSALAGSDYTATSGTMTFEAGETSKNFRIPLIQDSLSDPEETVNMSLNTPTNGATLGDPSFAVLTIQ